MLHNDFFRWRGFHTHEENAKFFAELKEREEMLTKNNIILQWDNITTDNYLIANRTTTGASKHRHDGEVQAWTEPMEEAAKDVVEGNGYSENSETK